jgi:hypothetical protein
MADDDDINDPDLVAKVSGVLLSPECQRINFRWGKQHINAKAYRAVVFAMVDSRIHLYEADAEHKLDPGVEAVYREGSETMIIGPHLNMHRIYNRMTIVHESTHAVQDAQLAGEWIWRLDKEAIAFVAEWLYDIYSSPDRNNLRNKPDPDDPIEVTAAEIARSLADRPGASPDPAAMRRLGDAIYADPTYSVRMLLHPWARGDGVAKPRFP